MTDYAFVIGIDDYVNHRTGPQPWTLKAAVRDALAFARWVVEPGAGRATPTTLTLLLSPREGRSLEVPEGAEVRPATWLEIRRTFREFTKLGRGTDGDRLWFYYAGHAVTQRMVDGVNTPPILLPHDAMELDFELGTRPIPLDDLVRPLQVKGPREQLYFVDGCRDLADSGEAVERRVEFTLDLNRVDAEAEVPSQAVLFATSIGLRAHEIGLHGVFSRLLLEGLRGRGPMLERVDGLSSLTFRRLAEFVEDRIRARREVHEDANLPFPTQTPRSSTSKVGGDFVLVPFPKGTRPRAKLSVLVAPDEVFAAARAGVVYWDDFHETERLGEPQGPPLSSPVEWELAFGKHTVEVNAPGFDCGRAEVELYEERQLVEVTLQRVEESGLESMPRAIADVTPIAERVRDAKANATTGRLVVKSPDRRTSLRVFGPDRELVQAAFGRLDLAHAGVGQYRIEVTHPGHDAVVRDATVWPGETCELLLSLDAPLAPALAFALDGWRDPDGRLEPSEMFGPVVAPSLGTLLAWAVWASRFEGSSYGSKLRSLGVGSQGVLPSDGEHFLLVLGDAGSSDALAGSAEAELGGARLQLQPVPELGWSRVASRRSHRGRRVEPDHSRRAPLRDGAPDRPRAGLSDGRRRYARGELGDPGGAAPHAHRTECPRPQRVLGRHSCDAAPLASLERWGALPLR